MATASKKTTTEKKSRYKKTADDYKKDLEKAEANIKLLKEKAYASELDALLKKQNIVSSFNVIKANVQGISDLQILTAIGKAAGIKRLVVSQTPAVVRAKPTK
jgi:hypothetical protein